MCLCALMVAMKEIVTGWILGRDNGSGVYEDRARASSCLAELLPRRSLRLSWDSGAVHGSRLLVRALLPNKTERRIASGLRCTLDNHMLCTSLSQALCSLTPQ